MHHWGVSAVPGQQEGGKEGGKAIEGGAMNSCYTSAGYQTLLVAEDGVINETKVLVLRERTFQWGEINGVSEMYSMSDAINKCCKKDQGRRIRL